MKHFLNKLINLSVSNILQLGMVDLEDKIAEVIAIEEYYIIEFGNLLLKLESINQNSRLKLFFIEKIIFDIEIDEDMIPFTNSVINLVLDDSMANNEVKKIEIFGFQEFNNNHMICDALSLHLKSGQELFFDPSFIFGINIGGKRKRDSWFLNLHKDYIERIEILS